MKQFIYRCRSTGLVCALLVGSLFVSAQAATVTQELFKTTTLATAANMNATEFNLSSPGTLVISMTDLKWPALLDTLSFSILDSSAHVLQTYKSNGATDNWTFNVTAPGVFYGAIYAKPAAGALAGMYYAKVSYETVSAVPLPAAAWFLLSGIAGLVAFRPKQKLSQI